VGSRRVIVSGHTGYKAALRAPVRMIEFSAATPIFFFGMLMAIGADFGLGGVGTSSNRGACGASRTKRKGAEQGRHGSMYYATGSSQNDHDQCSPGTAFRD